MATIFGALGVNDHDYVFRSTLGQDVIYTAITDYIARVQSDLAGQMRLFVSGPTEMYTERYKLPTGGRMQEIGLGVYPGVTKRVGSWDVAYPLKNFGDGMAVDDITQAYMTAQELQLHIDTALNHSVNTQRFEMLYSIFNNTAKSVVDMIHGTLTVQPLANGDSVTYPPVLGSETAATENHYLESGYAASAISDTNNPYHTIADELEEHFGTMTGGDNIVVLINKAQTKLSLELTEMSDVPDQFINVSVDANVPVNYPPIPSTARLIGRCSGVWVAEWAWMPANYMFGTHIMEPAPLKMRVDPAAVGLGQGLQLVKEDNEFPMRKSYWRNRFGFGVGNRLNGVVMELGTGGTYTIPSGYS